MESDNVLIEEAGAVFRIKIGDIKKASLDFDF